jgi:uncharacterized peroxidase-related enzyme
MPRILPLDPDKAEPAVKATLSAVKAKLGLVPNLFATFAVSPAVLNGYLALSEALGKGVLTAKQREIVALAVAQANECHYCLSAHTLLGKGAGLSEAAIAKARAGHGETPIDDAIAVLARRLVEARGHASDADIAAARKAGLTDAHVVETIASVAINVLTNFTNNVARTEIDFPKVDVAMAA